MCKVANECYKPSNNLLAVKSKKLINKTYNFILYISNKNKISIFVIYNFVIA